MKFDDVEKMTPKRLEAKWHINGDTGYLLRAVYGKTERFVLHDHEFYEIFLTVSGNIMHYVNGEVKMLEPGSMVFMRPGDIHGYLYSGEDIYNFVNLAFSRECAESMLEYVGGATDVTRFTQSRFPVTVKLSKNETAAVIKKLDSLNAVSKDDHVASRIRIREVLFDLFVNYFLRSGYKEESFVPKWLDETMQKMKKRENFIAGTDRMAELSGKSKEHLARSMKKYTGMTLSRYINDLRINYAANLLLNTNLSVTDICFESGFGNVSCFYKSFDEAYGVSPNKYRKGRF